MGCFRAQFVSEFKIISEIVEISTLFVACSGSAGNEVKQGKDGAGNIFFLSGSEEVCG
jgi:hypothetical protein